MEQNCGNCKHFVRHYIKWSGRFSPIDHGHCKYPMLKNRTVDHKACKYFEEKDKSEEEKVLLVTIKTEFI